jgi:hypothetical protein
MKACEFEGSGRADLTASTGDECGGRGGELGRGLEALLSIDEGGDGGVLRNRRSAWDTAHESDYGAEAE